MKKGRFEAYLKAIGPLITAQTVTACRTLEANYKISLFIAKSRKNHTIEESLETMRLYC